MDNSVDIWHIAIPVEDLERAVDFYCGNLGFEMVGRDEHPTMRQAFVSLAKGGFTIELFVPQGDEAAKPRLRPDHLAFECKDIDGYRAKILESGLAVPAVETFSGGMKHFELRDPDDTKLDFFQGRVGYESFLAGN
ncbi:MAG TPA: VOC family protein [Caulobacteraceae bacterium]|jgi:lactoylglutathione lyase